MSKAIEHEIAAEVKKWLQLEEAEQHKRYEQIVREMDNLDAGRQTWFEAVLQRIQTEGMNVDGDLKIKIPAQKIPKKPKGKKTRVVY